MHGSDALPNTNGLMGHTGFVGSALMRQARFAACFNSANIADISGRRFGTLVCAAAPGSMLEANRAPDRDAAQIDALVAQLATVRAERFVLISSIAVLADCASGADESTQAFQQDIAYGRHRRALEAFAESHFAHSLIVRLPALFGPGLRKNFLHDLLNPVPTLLTAGKRDALISQLDPDLAAWVGALYSADALTGLLRLDRPALNADRRRAALDAAVTALGASAIQFHRPETTYQYYPVSRLWQDIGIALETQLSHLHLVAAPVPAATIHRRLTGLSMPTTNAHPHHEDMRTRHAALWGTDGPYQFDAAATLEQLAAFFASEKAAA